MNASESAAALFLFTFSSESDKKARELELAGFMAEKAAFTALLEDLAIARSRDRKVWFFLLRFSPQAANFAENGHARKRCRAYFTILSARLL